jgi:hypothetical protein
VQGVWKCLTVVGVGACGIANVMHHELVNSVSQSWCCWTRGLPLVRGDNFDCALAVPRMYGAIAYGAICLVQFQEVAYALV